MGINDLEKCSMSQHSFNFCFLWLWWDRDLKFESGVRFDTNSLKIGNVYNTKQIWNFIKLGNSFCSVELAVKKDNSMTEGSFLEAQ